MMNLNADKNDMKVRLNDADASVKPIKYNTRSKILTVLHPDGERSRHRVNLPTVLTWQRTRKAADVYFQSQIWQDVTGKPTAVTDEPDDIPAPSADKPAGPLQDLS